MLSRLDWMYLYFMQWQARTRQSIRDKARELWEEEKGSTSTIVVEIVMVGMVLVLAFVFRKQIGNLFSQLWESLVHFDDNGNDAPSIGSMENPFG